MKDNMNKTRNNRSENKKSEGEVTIDKMPKKMDNHKTILVIM